MPCFDSQTRKPLAKTPKEKEKVRNFETYMHHCVHVRSVECFEACLLCTDVKLFENKFSAHIYF